MQIDGATPLFIAIMKGHTDVVHVLTASGTASVGGLSLVGVPVGEKTPLLLSELVRKITLNDDASPQGAPSVAEATTMNVSSFLLLLLLFFFFF